MDALDVLITLWYYVRAAVADTMTSIGTSLWGPIRSFLKYGSADDLWSAGLIIAAILGTIATLIWILWSRAEDRADFEEGHNSWS